MSRSPADRSAQGIGIRAAGWTSLRIFLLQVAVSASIAWGVALYGQASPAYPGLPDAIATVLHKLSLLVPCAYEHANASTGNEGLIRDFLTILWVANLVVGSVHLTFLRASERFFLVLAERRKSRSLESGLPREFWLFPAMLLATGVLSLAGASVPVLRHLGSGVYPDALGLSAQACAASALWFSVCTLISMHRSQSRQR